MAVTICPAEAVSGRRDLTGSWFQREGMVQGAALSVVEGACGVVSLWSQEQQLCLWRPVFPLGDMLQRMEPEAM